MKSVNVDVPQILTSQNDFFLYFGESAGSTTPSDSERHLVHAQAKEKKKSGT